MPPQIPRPGAATGNSDRKTGRKQFYFWILIKLIFGYFVLLKIYTKTIIRLRLSDYGEYSPVIISPSANNC
jgi:hypothetical protein